MKQWFAWEREPNGFIYVTYLGAVLLAIGLVTLGVGLLYVRRTAGE